MSDASDHFHAAETLARKHRAEGLREAVEIAAKCFGPADEKLTVSEAQGYDIAMGRIEEAILDRADAIERGEA